MAICYVAHRYGGDPANLERAKKITHDLQVTDLDNCYICPLLAFSHLKYGEIQYENEIALCFDILEMCSNPSFPPPKSTNAPKVAIFVTVPV